MKKYIALFLILAVMPIAACSAEGATDQPDNPAIGAWNMYSVVINGDEYIGESADAVLAGASSCVLTVTKEGTFDFSIGGADVIGTYEARDGAISFYEDNSEFPVTVSGGKLTIDLTSYSEMDMQYIFVKGE